MMQIKRLLVGKPLESAQQQHQRLTNPIALAVFSSDALSSVAYASEAILGVLILAGSAALPWVIPVSIAIAGLLFIVGLSYRQTIFAYPSGGGAYIVAHENLGKLPGLVAAASLLIDYVLTVAVSISAGVAALSSLATTWGFSQFENYRVDVALLMIAVVTVINLRGIKESGTFFAVPTYVFILSTLALIAVGLGRIFFQHAPPIAPVGVPSGVETLGLFLLLRAFSAGCTAMTGVEAISNAIPSFRKPESRNAATTLMTMIVVLGLMFLGISVLANYYGAVPHEGGETVLSQLARQVIGTGPAYFVIQAATALILLLAANTSFNGFPPLASLLSRDRYLPRQFASRGDRLVFSNGIILLAVFAALLVIGFDAREQAMLPLYAIGVFISFTLSQFGMLKHHLHHREPGYQRGIVINGIGGTLTTIILIVLIITRFTEGAWAVLLLVPVIVLAFRAVNTHYRTVARQLSLEKASPVEAVRRHTALVLVSGMHRGVLPALQFAKSLAPDNTTALYVDMDPEATEKVRAKWGQWEHDIPLVVLPAPYRSLVRPILRYIDELDKLYEDDVLSVIVPEFVPSLWWEHLLHNQTALLIRTALLFRRGIVIISVPYHLERGNSG